MKMVQVAIKRRYIATEEKVEIYKEKRHLTK
jgi:hypothetical protein